MIGYQCLPVLNRGITSQSEGQKGLGSISHTNESDAQRRITRNILWYCSTLHLFCLFSFKKIYLFLFSSLFLSFQVERETPFVC